MLRMCKPLFAFSGTRKDTGSKLGNHQAWGHLDGANNWRVDLDENPGAAKPNTSHGRMSRVQFAVARMHAAGDCRRPAHQREVLLQRDLVLPSRGVVRSAADHTKGLAPGLHCCCMAVAQRQSPHVYSACHQGSLCHDFLRQESSTANSSTLSAIVFGLCTWWPLPCTQEIPSALHSKLKRLFLWSQ